MTSFARRAQGQRPRYPSLVAMARAAVALAAALRRTAVFGMAAGLGMAAPAFANDPPEWSTPVQPFNIAGNIFYVGTQGLAAYLIVSNDGAILLDGTTAKNAPLIEHSIEQVGVPLRRSSTTPVRSSGPAPATHGRWSMAASAATPTTIPSASRPSK
jgi:hypothetical protein